MRSRRSTGPGRAASTRRSRSAPTIAARRPRYRTLIHGDFHPWNVLGATIVDWSDAAVANPLHNVPEERRYELLDTYSAAWGDDVAAEADACEAETYEYIAQSYAQITAALAPDDRWVFAGAEARWLARASDVRAGKRPSRDM